jgi:hypothetical protein
MSVRLEVDVRPGIVGGGVVDGVRGGTARVNHHVADQRSIEERADGELEVGLWAGDRGAQVGLGVA